MGIPFGCGSSVLLFVLGVTLWRHIPPLWFVCLTALLVFLPAAIAPRLGTWQRRH
jgi:hypothetical protein